MAFALGVVAVVIGALALAIAHGMPPGFPLPLQVYIIHTAALAAAFWAGRIS